MSSLMVKAQAKPGLAISQKYRTRPWNHHRSSGFWGALELCLCLAGCMLALPPGHAQNAAIEATPSTGAIVPGNLVRWTGSVPEESGRTVKIRFGIYQDQAGGLALWSETQSIKVGADGRYTVLLGVTSADGLPPTLFQSGEARWIEAKVTSGSNGNVAPDSANSTAPPRSLLAAVPYAFKSVDAETLAGRAAEDYVTHEDLQSAVAATMQTAAKVNPDSSPTITGTGTTGRVPVWTGDSTLGNSVIAESGTKIGIGTAAPASTLDVKGTTTLREAVTLPATGATATAGGDSPSLELSASSFLKSDAVAVPQNFAWQAVSANNNTANPSANLQLQFGKGTAAPMATGLSIAPTGQITFAAGQRFPGTGAGTITGVTATSPLTATTNGGAVSLGLNTPALETTLNGAYAQLAASNTFTGTLNTFNGTVAAFTSAADSQAITGRGNSGASGVWGVSDKGFGVVGISGNPVNGAASVMGYNGAFSSIYSAVAKTSTASIWGDIISHQSGGAAVIGTAAGGYGGAFYNATTSYPALYANNSAAGAKGVFPVGVEGAVAGEYGNGVYGSASGNEAKGVAGIVTGNGGIGVYGENTGALDSTTGDYPAGVLGTALGKDGSGVWGNSSGAGGWAVYGHASGAADTVPGHYNSVGAFGYADSGIGVLGVTSGYSATYNLLIETLNAFPLKGGVWGDSGDAAAHSLGGVVGTADNLSAGAFENNSEAQPTVYAYNAYNSGKGPTGLFKVFKASTPDGTCGIGGGSLLCTGQLVAMATTGGGARTVETYSVQSPENWMEDFGSGDLVSGLAVVKIDPAFAETVTADASYHVFITPNGDSKGLYVIRKTPTSFEVRESGGGTSSLSFDYRIVARRRGYEAQRLTDVTERFNAEQAETNRHLPAH